MAPSGDAYTFAEFERMCRAAGFSEVALVEPAASAGRDPLSA